MGSFLVLGKKLPGVLELVLWDAHVCSGVHAQQQIRRGVPGKSQLTKSKQEEKKVRQQSSQLRRVGEKAGHKACLRV